MPLSAAAPETRPAAVTTGGRVVALPGAGLDRAPNAAHDHAAHDHAAHDHAAHDHAPHSHGAERPAVRLRPSVLRLSLGGRLVIAGALIAALWTVVALVTGGAA